MRGLRGGAAARDPAVEPGQQGSWSQRGSRQRGCDGGIDALVLEGMLFSMSEGGALSRGVQEVKACPPQEGEQIGGRIVVLPAVCLLDEEGKLLERVIVDRLNST